MIFPPAAARVEEALLLLFPFTLLLFVLFVLFTFRGEKALVKFLAMVSTFLVAKSFATSSRQRGQRNFAGRIGLVTLQSFHC